jgi:ATP-dependent DNA helicase DinG
VVRPEPSRVTSGTAGTAVSLDAATKSLEELFDDVLKQLGVHERRPSQMQMAREVASVLEKESSARVVIQAGTGVGKSLGYLVPIADRIRRSNYEERALVVTVGKPLQAQLRHKELQYLARADGQLRVAVLKGREEYGCVAKVAEHMGVRKGARATSSQAVQLPRLPRRITFGDQDPLDAFCYWLFEKSKDGDLADYSGETSSSDLRRFVTSALECPRGNDCYWGKVCFAEAARQRAQEAHICVVNAHLYGLALKEKASGGLAPAWLEADMLVIDECHAVVDVLEEVLGLAVPLRQRKGQLARLARELKTNFSPFGKPLDKAISKAEEAVARADPEGSSVILDDDERLQIADALSVAVGEMKMNNEFGEWLRKDPRELDERKKRQVTMVRSFLREFEEAASSLSSGQGSSAFLVSREPLPSPPASSPAGGSMGAGGSSKYELVVREVVFDAGRYLEEDFSRRRAVVCTSATISPEGADRLWTGSPPGSEVYVSIKSPFDYASQAVLYIPSRVHAPEAVAVLSRNGVPGASRKSGNPLSEERKLEEIEWLVRLARGGALVLCTSRKFAIVAYERLVRVGQELGFQVHSPYVSGSGERALASFKKGTHDCLVGSMGFFQGVDVAGFSLRLVILDNLPFPAPSDGRHAARRRWAEATFGNGQAFRVAFSEPMTTRLCQAIGRLIRSGSDKGVVAVLDPRLTDTRLEYAAKAREAIGALYPGLDTVRTREELEERVKRFGLFEF